VSNRGFNYILLNKIFTSVFSIKESRSTDVVKYTIYKTSDGSVLSTGNAVYLAGINWKVTFTPPTIDTYVVEVENTTIDIKYCAVFQAVEVVSIAYGGNS